jgi:hypothetical protein
MAGDRRGVVHVTNESADDRAITHAQAAIVSRWHELGYAVTPAPGDGAGHTFDAPCPVCALAPDQLAALRAVAQLWREGEPWPTGDQVDARTGGNSTRIMAPLATAGLVRRIRYGRRYAYQLTAPGLDALNRGGAS